MFSLPANNEPLVVAVSAPFPPDPTLQDLLSRHGSKVDVHFTPYGESREVRASKGANNGAEPLGLPVPEITDETRAIWERAHVLVGIDLPAQIDELCPNLVWFQAVSAGVDQIDHMMLADMSVRLATASGIASASIAEFVMARLLEVWKDLRAIEAQQRDQVWTEVFGTEVGGRTLLIAGLGSIGRQIARRARAFDMTVIATRGSAQPGDEDPDADELHPASALDTLLPRADAIVCALPVTPATIDLFDADRFAAMKSDAIFCNIGRGSQVVEADLISTLDRGHLRAAVLDVTRNEPIPKGDPLWTAPRLYVSPHSAVSIDHYQQNAWKLLDENMGLLLGGERMINEVDLAGLGTRATLS